MENKFRYMVCTLCETYNHGAYIREAMKGFAMQETSFPIVTIIVDDASIDDAPSKIKSFFEGNCDLSHDNSDRRETDYAIIEQAPLLEHPNHLFVLIFLKENHYGKKKQKLPYLLEWYEHAKYRAICEGDDYWTHSKKLQMQVDFMESHPHLSLCFCSHKELLPNGCFNEIKRYGATTPNCPMEDIIVGGGGYMATCSMLYVGELQDNYPDWAKDTPVGDLPLMLVLSLRGSVGYLNETMCVYRRSAVGSWNNQIVRNRSMQKNHYEGSVKMWEGFDMFTDKKYHNLIIKKLKQAKKHYWELSFKYFIKYQFKQ